jgi:hypothetical protein
MNKKTKHSKILKIILDNEEIDKIEFVTAQLHLIEGVTFSKIVPDTIEVIATIEKHSFVF